MAIKDETYELDDTGWVAEAQLCAELLDAAAIIVRTSENKKEVVSMLERLSETFISSTKSVSISKSLREAVDKIANDVAINNKKKSEINSIKAAQMAINKKSREGVQKFTKQNVLKAEKKAILLLRKNNYVLLEIAEHLNKRYARQIQETGYAPFSATDIYRILPKEEKH